jgi:16S rRNA (guanine527-N7)-methyltransferase
MNELSDQRLAKILAPFGVESNPALFSSIRAYVSLLLQWNEKISLTSIKSPDEIVRLHFGESFVSKPLFSAQNCRLADVGSGAGFPGIPIKMLIPELHLTLIESNGKKAAFLGEVVRKLNFSSVETINARMENVAEDILAFDFVTARAVGNHKGLLMWARRHLTAHGKVILFVSERGAETISKDGNWSWAMKSNPTSKSRVILSGSLR